ncbi:MAG: hypothetical protein JWP35_1473 [Caulobacter sp.]|nr:hypothetical protein [Caulobacter sp.]
MNYRNFAAAAGMVAALAFASQALAQAAAAPRPAAPAAPAQPPIAFAPAPAGVCVLDLSRMGATSLAGKAAAARMKVIQDQVSADINTQAKQLQTDAAALGAAKATLDQATYETRAANLQVRANALQRLADQRQAELERTAQIAQASLMQAADPSVRAVFQTQHCSMLFDRSSLFIVNPSADITEAVVANLNARVQTLNFDRATLPPQAQAPRQ